MQKAKEIEKIMYSDQSRKVRNRKDSGKVIKVESQRNRKKFR